MKFVSGQYKIITEAVTGKRIRFGKRETQFIIDVELTTTGFNGVQNVDWFNIKTEYYTSNFSFKKAVRNGKAVIDVELTATGFNGVQNVDWFNIASNGVYSNILNRNATKTLIPLITYDGGGETCHPSIVSFASVWNGYKYWMANTPYPASNSAYENPSIWASNDGNSWVVPAGLTNPIIPKPVSSFNADTDLFFENNKLYLMWKDGTDSSTKMCNSTDGIIWSAPVIVLMPISGESQCVSPSLIKIGSVYYIYYTSLAPALLNSEIKRVSCTTIDGTYVGREIVKATPAGISKIWWHFSISYINGYYWMPAMSSTGNNPGSEIYLLKSLDGLTFVKAPNPNIFNSGNTNETVGFYRPCLVVIEGQPTLFYGAKSTTKWSLMKVLIDLF